MESTEPRWYKLQNNTHLYYVLVFMLVIGLGVVVGLLSGMSVLFSLVLIGAILGLLVLAGLIILLTPSYVF